MVIRDDLQDAIINKLHEVEELCQQFKGYDPNMIIMLSVAPDYMTCEQINTEESKFCFYIHYRRENEKFIYPYPDVTNETK